MTGENCSKGEKGYANRKVEILVISWPCGVTVSTLDSESSDCGSNPREAFAMEMRHKSG